MQLQEEALFTLKMDGKPILNQLGELEKALTDVKEQQKNVEKGTKEWTASKAEIKALEAEIRAVREEMGVSGMTVQQLKDYYKVLNKEIDQLTPGTEAYIQKAAQMQEVDQHLKDHRGNIRAVNEENEKQPGLWGRVKEAAAGYLAAFSLTAAFERFVQFIADGIGSALELTDAMGGIAKATGMSSEQVGGLVDKLNQIDTRTSQQALLDIAQIGGQLGVANKDLLGFVEGVDRAVVALGDEFTGGAEEVAASLGGLQKLFKETADLAPGDAINRVGSALNALGAAGSATAPVVAEFTARMGQLGDLSPQITQTMGLGAAFQELGLSAEISAGGLSNILLTAAKSTDEFAKHLGMTEAEFKKLINTDPNAFLLKMAESFKGVPADELAKQLSGLGINSQEATKVMSLLKDQTELVTTRQKQANTAYTEGTSLLQEFNTMNSTAAAEYDKSQKAIALLAQEVGLKLLPFITGATQGVIGFVNILKAAPEWISENRTTLAALGVAILAMNTNLITATASSLAHSAAEKARIVWTEAGTVAQWAMNAAMSANPIAAVVAALALLVAGLTAAYNNSETFRGIVNGMWAAMKTAGEVVSDLYDSLSELVSSALSPLIDTLGSLLNSALSPVQQAFSALWDMLSYGWNILVGVEQAVSSFAVNAVGGLLDFLAPLQANFAQLWGSLQEGVQHIMRVGSAIASFLHIDDMVSKALESGKKVGKAFTDTYNAEADGGREKDTAATNAHLDAKAKGHAANAQAIGKKETDEDAAAIGTKTQQNDTHRKQELEKAQQKAQQEREAREKANKDALDKMEQMHIDAIKNELDRDIARLQFKHDKEVDAVEKSKASESVKTQYIHELNEKLITDIAAKQEEHRRKQSEADQKAIDAVDQLRINAVKDEETRQILLLQAKRDKEVEAIANSKASQEIKAEWEKALNDQLVRDIDKVQTEQREKRAAEEAKQRQEREARDRETADTIATAEYDMKRLSLQKQLNDEKTTADQKKQIKLDLIKLEKDEEYRKIDAIYERKRKDLDDQKADAIKKAKDQGQETESIEESFRRAYEAADASHKAALLTAYQEWSNKKKDIDSETTKTLSQNLKEYFDMGRALLKGDLDGFTEALATKLGVQKENLSEERKAMVEASEFLSELNHAYFENQIKLSNDRLQNELKNLKSEYETLQAQLKAKYNAGLISQSDYEKQSAALSAEYAEKEKQAKITAWKHEQNLRIKMAIIDAAAAALKSLAMLGWPLGLIGVAAAGVAAAIQISQIKKQQPPSYALGGRVRNAGVPEGPRHGKQIGDGGISLIRNDTGQLVGEMEGGEPIMILSRNTYANNRGVVDKLMHSSLHRNGAPIYANGGFSDGGSYSDYVPKFVDGGSYGADSYADEPVFDSSTGGSGGGGATDPNGGDDIVDMSTAQYDDQLREEQIKESQATMNAIKVATENTLGVVTDMLEVLRTNLPDTFITAIGGLQDSVVSTGKQLDTQLNSANGFLMLIEKKELSISVQNIIDVHNDIHVTVQDSGMN